jgi:hypothetical protein
MKRPSSSGKRENNTARIELKWATATLTIPTKSSAVQKSKPTVPFFNNSAQQKKPAPSSDENARRSYTSLHAGASAGDRMNPVFFFQRTLNPI